MDSFSRMHLVSQLTSLCRDHPAEEKVVFVPTLQIGHNLGTALARSGTEWVNLRMTTPAAWADRLAGSTLRKQGRRPLVQDADAFFILESIRGETSADDHPFYQADAAQGFANTLLKTIRALRLAGISPEDLDQTSAGIAGILARQYAAYCEWMDEQQVYDRAALFRIASTKGSDPDTIYAILEEVSLPERAYAFVHACSGGRMLRIGGTVSGISPPQHSAGVRFSSASALNGHGIFGRGGYVLTDGLSEVDRNVVALRTAVGLQNEIRGPLRELLARGAVLDDIEIAYTSESPYLPLLVEETERLKLPATFGAGVPVTYTRPGQALLGFLRWIASGFDPEELIRLFRSRLIFLGGNADSLEVAAVGAMLIEARVGPGRTSWRAPFDRYIERIDARLDAAESDDGKRFLAYQRDAVGRANQHLERLFGLCPSWEAIRLNELCESALRYLDRFAAWEGDRDTRAAESLSDRLIDLGDGAPIQGPLPALAAMLADLILAHKVEAAVARPGRLNIVPLERAGYSGRRETVIVGMAETTFPGPALEDPMLLDETRKHFNGKLKLQRTRVGDPAFHLIRVMGMANGRVTLTANVRDVTDGREVYPSAIFEQVKEQLGIDDVPAYSAVPDVNTALTDAEVALSLRRDGDITADLEGEFPWLEAGRRAMEARAAGEVGRYDGWLAQRTPDLRPGMTSVMSASRLEDLAACPYRYFLKNVLYVRPPDIPEDIPGRWLTPLEFGGLLHGVLRAFMERIANQGEAVDARIHSRLMEEILDAEIERFKQRIPVRFEAGYRADRQRLLRAVRVFLAEESRREAKPVGFEVSFGLGQTSTFDVPDPVEIQLSNGVSFALRGAIDRVDRTDDGYEIWDYKTGSTYDFEEYDLLSGGRRLQWALYAYALDEVFRRRSIDGSVTRSGYFFTSDREHGLRLSEPPPDRGEIGKRLSPLFELIGKGAFLHVQKSKACTYCDYSEVCSAERKDSNDMDEIIRSARSEHDFVADLEEWMDYEK